MTISFLQRSVIALESSSPQTGSAGAPAASSRETPSLTPPSKPALTPPADHPAPGRHLQLSRRSDEDAPEAALATELDPSIALALRAQGGDPEALTQLLSEVKQAVWRAACLVLGRAHPDVEDVVQQALFAFVQALPRFRAECQPAGYAARIAVRTAVSARRKGSLELRRNERLAVEVEPPQAIPNPGELTLAARRRALLLGLLEELPDNLADTLALRTLLGYSLGEVASITGAPVNTVRSRTRLAKEALRKRIEGDPELIQELGVTR